MLLPTPVLTVRLALRLTVSKGSNPLLQGDCFGSPALPLAFASGTTPALAGGAREDQERFAAT
ncbi:MAG: hypothetical protein Q8K73_00375 [Anaerolineales bacterium]|nr:hypothetical protein [Anaerolineales bacterium]